MTNKPASFGRPLVLLVIVLLAVAVIRWNRSPPVPGTTESSSLTPPESSAAPRAAKSGMTQGRPAPVRGGAPAVLASPLSAMSPSEDALKALQNSSRTHWQAKADPFSGRPRTLSAGHLDPAPGLSLAEKAQAFVNTRALGLFGVGPEHLRPSGVVTTDRTQIIYDEVVNGYPVYGGRLALTFEGPDLVRVQNDLVSLERLPNGPPALPLEQAFAYYQTQGNPSGRAPSAQVAAVSQLVSGEGLAPAVLLYPSAGRLVYVHQIYVDEGAPQGPKIRYRVLIDAQDPHVVKKQNMHIE